ncbi:MAG: hypothetical protein WCN98_00910 [Verrucomicrobiaceae bacterium]
MKSLLRHLRTGLFIYFLGLCFGATFAQEPPGVPQALVERGTGDEQNKLFLQWHAEPGLTYTLQRSLSENIDPQTGAWLWDDTGDFIYGLGADVKLHVATMTPPPVNNDPPTDTQLNHVPLLNVMFQPLAGSQGGVVVSWNSGSTGGSSNARQVYPTGDLTHLPIIGVYRTEDINIFWMNISVNHPLNVSNISTLNSPLNATQQIEWATIQSSMNAILGMTSTPSTLDTPGQALETNRAAMFWRFKVGYPDTDGDGIEDWKEIAIHHTNPFAADTDGDGVPDGIEILAGFNPTDANSKPTPLQLPVINYVAIDMSSATTDLPIVGVALDDNNAAAFAYDDGTYLKSATWVNGSASPALSITKAHSRDGNTSGTYSLGGTLFPSPNCVNVAGHLCGSIKYEGVGSSFWSAFLADSNTPSDIYPTSSSGGTFCYRASFLGNTEQIFAIFYNGPSVVGNGSTNTWFDDSSDNGTLELTAPPSFGGHSFGRYYSSSADPNAYSTYPAIDSLGSLHPLAVNDSNVVLGNLNDCMAISVPGSSPQTRVTSLLTDSLPEAYKNSIRFPSTYATPLLNNNGDMVIPDAQVLEGSPAGPQWETHTLLWRKSENTLSIVQLPPGISSYNNVLAQFNNSRVITAIGPITTTDDAGNQTTKANRAMFLVPVDIDYVFGFGPTDATSALAKQDLEYELDQMQPVFKDIKPDKSIFVFKGNPQGNKDASAKDTKQWVIRISKSGDALKTALSSTPYVIFNGHSNMGLGPMFDVPGATSTSSFLNIGNPQTAINYKWMVATPANGGEGFVNLKLPDNEVAGTVKNYWVLENVLGQSNERYDNGDNIHPPAGIPFTARNGKPKNQGLHFNRDNQNDEFVIVNIPQEARAADLPKLGYKAFFYHACSTVRDYSEVFAANKGSVFIGSNGGPNQWITDKDGKFVRYSKVNFIFAKKLMAGESWDDIVDAINDEQSDVDQSDEAFRALNF